MKSFFKTIAGWFRRTKQEDNVGKGCLEGNWIEGPGGDEPHNTVYIRQDEIESVIFQADKKGFLIRSNSGQYYKLLSLHESDGPAVNGRKQ